jgi:hypothetical protein
MGYFLMAFSATEGNLLLVFVWRNVHCLDVCSAFEVVEYLNVKFFPKNMLLLILLLKLAKNIDFGGQTSGKIG